MTISTVRGQFGTVSGTVEYDPKNVAATKIDATVGVTSVDTQEPKRDDHLRSPDFFDAAKFPNMTFKSKSVKNVAADGFDVVGDLTIHGVTKETTFHVATFSPEVKDPFGNIKIGTHATAKVNRQDFGLTFNKQLDSGGYLVGDDVQIELDVEMAKSK
jgi:polyisoprenoid-binding protein YceI